MLGMAVLCVVVLLAMQRDNPNWWTQRGGVPVAPGNDSVVTTQGTQPSQGQPEIITAADKSPVTPPPQRKNPTVGRRQGTRPTTHPPAVARRWHDRDASYEGYARNLKGVDDTATGFHLGYNRRMRPSGKPMGDLLLPDNDLGEIERTSTAERARDWSASAEVLVQSAKVDNTFNNSMLWEMGRFVVVVNSGSNVFGKVLVESYPRSQGEIALEKTDGIYVEEPEAPSLDGISKKLMRKGYIDLLRKMGYSVLGDDRDDRFRARAILKLRYDSDWGKDEQVHTELYIRGRIVWSIMEGCPAASGLQSELCEESLKWGQSFRSRRWGEGE